MKLTRLSFCVGIALSVSVAGAESCSRVWNVAEVVRAAKELDGQVVCVRALLWHAPLQEGSHEGLAIYEAIPIDARDRRREANRIGLVDWDESLGIAESLYRPETFELIEKASAQCPGRKQSDLRYDAVFRASVKYKRGLAEHAQASLPPNLSEIKPSLRHHDVELVLLELLKVTSVCDK